MKVTKSLFLIGCLALSALPPFLVSGFYSKDAILFAAFESSSYGILTIAIVVAALTAFYMFRVYYVVFARPLREENMQDVHEPPVMLIPMAVLAACSVFAGWVPLFEFTAPLSLSQHEPPMPLLAVAIIASISGWGIAWKRFARRTLDNDSLDKKWYRVTQNKFYVDEAYSWFLRTVLDHGASRGAEIVETAGVDSTVDKVGSAAHRSGEVLRLLSTGQVHHQMFAVAFGVIAALCLVVLFLM